MTQEQIDAFNKISSKYNFSSDSELSSNPQVAAKQTESMTPTGLTSIAKGAEDTFIGIGKGAIETVKGASSFGEKMLRTIAHPIKSLKGEFKGVDTAAQQLIPEELVEAENKAQEFGKGLEKVGEVLLPAGAISKAEKGMSLMQKVLTEGIIGGGYQAVQSGGIDSNTGIATALSSAVPVVGALIKAGVKQIPRLVSYVTGMSDDALKAYVNDASKVNNYIKNNKGIKDALGTVQDAQGKLRNKLTQEFGQGIATVKEVFPDTSVQFTTQGKNGIAKLVDKYGELVTQYVDDVGNNIDINIANPGAEESVNILKNINALKRQTVGVEQSLVKRISDNIKKDIYKTFGGDNGLMKNLFENYSDEKAILDASEDIIKAGKSNPKAISGALTKLQTIFNDNKGAYVNMIKKLEDITGTDILSQISAGQLTKSPVGGSQNFIKVLLGPIIKQGVKLFGTAASKLKGTALETIGKEVLESNIPGRATVGVIANTTKQ